MSATKGLLPMISPEALEFDAFRCIPGLPITVTPYHGVMRALGGLVGTHDGSRRALGGLVGTHDGPESAVGGLVGTHERSRRALGGLVGPHDGSRRAVGGLVGTHEKSHNVEKRINSLIFIIVKKNCMQGRSAAWIRVSCLCAECVDFVLLRNRIVADTSASIIASWQLQVVRWIAVVSVHDEVPISFDITIASTKGLWQTRKDFCWTSAGFIRKSSP